METTDMLVLLPGWLRPLPAGLGTHRRLCSRHPRPGVSAGSWDLDRGKCSPAASRAARRLERRLEVRRQRRLDFDGRAAERMREREARRVQELPLEPELAR